MNKKIVIGLVAVILAGGGIYWFVQALTITSNSSPTETTPAPPSTSTPLTSVIKNLPPTPAPKTLPAQQLIRVTIKGFAFSPQTITVHKGDSVIWTNKDSMTHTVTGNSGGPASPPINTDGTYSFQFNNVGTFGYHCALHPSMTGTVVVMP